jgi:cytochrome c556
MIESNANQAATIAGMFFPIGSQHGRELQTLIVARLAAKDAATAKLVEAAEAILENAPTGDYADMTNVPEAVQRANALRTALAEYRLSACQ